MLGAALVVLLGEEVRRGQFNAEVRGHLQQCSHLIVREAVRLFSTGDGRLAEADSLAEPRLVAEPLAGGEVVDDVGRIGHGPILSHRPIIASPDLSDARRYSHGQNMGMTDSLPLGMKLKLARKAAGMTQKDLGDRLGVGQPTISDLESGGLASWHIHGSKLARIFSKPKAYFEPRDGEVSDEPTVMDTHGDEPDSVAIPEYDVRLSAGDGFAVDRESTRRFWSLPRFLVVDRLGLTPSNATIQEVIGDSMEPTLSSGDYVLIDLADHRLGLPGVFAVWDGDALVCKRLERVPGSEPAKVRLKSDNPLHGEYQVDEERVRVIGRVRWVTRRM